MKSFHKTFDLNYDAYGTQETVSVEMFSVLEDIPVNTNVPGEIIRPDGKTYITLYDAKKNITSIMPNFIDVIAAEICKLHSIDPSTVLIFEAFVKVDDKWNCDAYDYARVDANWLGDKFVITKIEPIPFADYEHNVTRMADAIQAYEYTEKCKASIANSKRKISDEMLFQIAQDIHSGKIFTDRQIQDKNMFSMVFPVMTMMDDKARKEMANDPPSMVFEYYDKALPRGVNGYPMFMSCQLVNTADMKKLMEIYNKLTIQYDNIKNAVLNKEEQK